MKMSKLRRQWEQYCDNPSDEENAEQLCKGIRKYARIVLADIKFNRRAFAEEDLLQLAYLCFFEKAKDHDKKKGTLEGFFIRAFRNDLIDMLRAARLLYHGDYSRVVDDSQNPIEELMFKELNEEIEHILSAEELHILNNYMKKGITDYKTIAELESVSEQEVEWAISSTRMKISQHLGRKID